MTNDRKTRPSGHTTGEKKGDEDRQTDKSDRKTRTKLP